MSTSEQYIELVCEQVGRAELGLVRYKKMFGEYMVYVNDKPILLVCENTVFVKKQPEKLPKIAALMKNSECGIPYKGAKEHYVLDIENAPFVKEVVSVLEEITPVPKPRNKKKKQ